MGRIILPFANPVNLIEASPVELPQYVSKFIDQYRWFERLSPQQQSIKPFYQPFQNSDVISTQFQSNVGVASIYLRNCKGHIIDSFVATQKQRNKYDIDYYIYESHIAGTPYPPGVYFLTYSFGDVTTLISEPFQIKEIHDNSLLFQYKHRHFKGKMIYETGIEPWIRVTGYLKKGTPVSKDTMYEDQVLDMTLIKSTPYRLFVLTLEQIPDWMAEIFNEILGCSDVRIDGRYFTKNGDDAKFEKDIESYYGALANYTIELRESINRNAKIIGVDENTNEEVTIMLNVDSKGFADTSEEASSSVVTFVDVE
jgi:hypothetical protein